MKTINCKSCQKQIRAKCNTTGLCHTCFNQAKRLPPKPTRCVNCGRPIKGQGKTGRCHNCIGWFAAAKRRQIARNKPVLRCSNCGKQLSASAKRGKHFTGLCSRCFNSSYDRRTPHSSFVRLSPTEAIMLWGGLRKLRASLDDQDAVRVRWNGSFDQYSCHITISKLTAPSPAIDINSDNDK